MDFQKTIRRFDRSDSRQTHFLHQAVLQGLEEPLDATFGLSIQMRRIATLRVNVSE
jgi:hypothetical protein